jgi:hypothetical protein
MNVSTVQERPMIAEAQPPADRWCGVTGWGSN